MKPSETCRTGNIPANSTREQDIPGEANVYFVCIMNLMGESVFQLYYGQPFQIGFICDILKYIPGGHFEISISTLDGTQVDLFNHR